MNSSDPNDEDALANDDVRPDVSEPATEATEPNESAIEVSTEFEELVSVSLWAVVEAGDGVVAVMEPILFPNGDKTLRPLLASLEAIERAVDEAFTADTGSLEVEEER